MNKMTVIQLLNKIANGEEVPKKIKWGVHNLTWYVYEYKALDELGEPNLFECAGSISSDILTDEVEIIEDTPKEDKKIEKFKVIKDNEGGNVFLDYDNKKYIISVVDAITLDKINEIIDKVNGE